MDSKKSEIGLLEILLIVFVILKLVGTIDWSWWWVLSPILISFALGVIILIISLVIALVLALVDKLKGN